MQCDAKKSFIKINACKVCNRRCTRWNHAVWEMQYIGLIEAKHPYFCLESTVLLTEEVRCFQFPKPSPLVFIQRCSVLPLRVRGMSADCHLEGMREWDDARESTIKIKFFCNLILLNKSLVLYLQ